MDGITIGGGERRRRGTRRKGVEKRVEPKQGEGGRMRENRRRGGKFYENLFLIWWPIVVYISVWLFGPGSRGLPSFHEAAPMFYRSVVLLGTLTLGCECRNARFFYSFRGNRFEAWRSFLN